MNTLSYEAFQALDPVARMSFARSGGRVTPSTPKPDPYAGLRMPLDGKARLAAIQAHDAMTKRIADDEKAMDAELAEQRATLARWQSER
jgi:hypothetical protein